MSLSDYLKLKFYRSNVQYPYIEFNSRRDFSLQFTCHLQREFETFIGVLAQFFGQEQGFIDIIEFITVKEGTEDVSTSTSFNSATILSILLRMSSCQSIYN